MRRKRDLEMDGDRRLRKYSDSSACGAYSAIQQVALSLYIYKQFIISKLTHRKSIEFSAAIIEEMLYST